RAEELLHTVACQLFGYINPLAAAVVALARQALGVLVREHRAGGLEHGVAHVVLGRDQLELRALAFQLARDRGVEFRILLLDRGRARFGHAVPDPDPDPCAARVPPVPARLAS